jgi:hypothetical protein
MQVGSPWQESPPTCRVATPGNPHAQRVLILIALNPARVDQIFRGEAPAFLELRASRGYTSDIEENLDLLVDRVKQSWQQPARRISCVEIEGLRLQ